MTSKLTVAFAAALLVHIVMGAMIAIGLALLPPSEPDVAAASPPSTRRFEVDLVAMQETPVTNVTATKAGSESTRETPDFPDSIVSSDVSIPSGVSAETHPTPGSESQETTLPEGGGTAQTAPGSIGREPMQGPAIATEASHERAEEDPLTRDDRTRETGQEWHRARQDAERAARDVDTRESRGALKPATVARKTPAPPSNGSPEAAPVAPASNQPESVTRGPITVRKSPPRYPRTLERKGIGGTVAIALQIDTTGRVSSAAVQSSSGQAELDRAALVAVQRWRFKPALKAGTAISSRSVVNIVFQPAN